MTKDRPCADSIIPNDPGEMTMWYSTCSWFDCSKYIDGHVAWRADKGTRIDDFNFISNIGRIIYDKCQVQG